MHYLRVILILILTANVCAYVFLVQYTWDPQIVVAPAGPGEMARHTNWAHQTFEPRLTSRGGWAVSERCRRPLSVLLLVYTAPNDRSRRAVLRDTLLEEAAARRFNWTAAFFIGQRRPAPRLEAWVELELNTMGDLVEFSFEDTYAAVSTKFVAAMRWAADNCPNVEYVIKMDDDVFIEPFQLQQYLERMAPLDPRSLHCYVWDLMHVYRDPTTRFFESYEDVPDTTFFPYCSGRSVIMTFDVMRDLLRAASIIRPHANDDAYVTGDLALVQGIGHVDISERFEWDSKQTDCIFNGSCIFTHESFKYGLTIGRRSQWGLLLWRQRLDAGETLDLSTRLQSADYVKEFNRTRAALLKVPPTTKHSTRHGRLRQRHRRGHFGDRTTRQHRLHFDD